MDDTIPTIIASISPTTILNQALRLTHVDDIIETKSPVTLFAPINDAFKDLDKSTLESLFSTNKNELRSILLSHVIKGVWHTEQLSEAIGSFETINKQRIYIYEMKGDLFVSLNKGQRAKIVISNIESTNGMIHCIDSLLN